MNYCLLYNLLYVDVDAVRYGSLIFSFFFNDTAPTEIYTLSLHDALPISRRVSSILDRSMKVVPAAKSASIRVSDFAAGDRKSTRLNSSHVAISYAVFCLKKKKNTIINTTSIKLHHTVPLACIS